MVGLARQDRENGPFVKILCDSGRGLTQVAISTETEDNGLACSYHEQAFTFKVDTHNVTASANLEFHLFERNLSSNQLLGKTKLCK